MIVCHCRAVSDRVVRAVIRSGADSLEEVTEQCGAGAGCGGCHPVIEHLLDVEHKSAVTC